MINWDYFASVWNKIVQNVCNSVNFCIDTLSAFITLPGLNLKLLKDLLHSIVSLWTLYLIIAGWFAAFSKQKLAKLAEALSATWSLNQICWKEIFLAQKYCFQGGSFLGWLWRGGPLLLFYSCPVMFSYIKELFFSCNGYVAKMSGPL